MKELQAHESNLNQIKERHMVYIVVITNRGGTCLIFLDRQTYLLQFLASPCHVMAPATLHRPDLEYDI